MSDNQNGWSVDLSSWTTMEPFETWMDAAREMDTKKMAEIMAGVIKTWPYEANPSDPNSYRKVIHPTQFWDAVKETGRVVGNFFRGTED